MQIKVLGYSYSTNDRNDGGAAEKQCMCIVSCWVLQTSYELTIVLQPIAKFNRLGKYMSQSAQITSSQRYDFVFL